MRVTWTELAKRNTVKIKEDTLNTSKRSVKEVPDENIEETAEFSLARQRENNMLLRGNDSDSESGDDDDEEAFVKPTGDGPVEYKSNIGRRKTLARN